VAVGSSDVPVVSCDPFVNLRSAVTRLTQDGQYMGRNQGVTIDEALQMFTINGAYASFEESIKGSITEGKLADLTVLSADPRSVEPEQLNTLQADLTMIDGKVVFER
jgi:predicted amidohydrolase YtcJ